MSSWISGLIVVAVIIAIALWRERSRVSGIEKWMEGRGFKRVFPVPPEGPQPAKQLVAAMSSRGARIWGMVLEGKAGDVALTVGEHESSVPGKQSGVWHTVAVWPVEGADRRIVMHRGTGPKALNDAARALGSAVLEPVVEALGLGERSDPGVETPGGWTVFGDPAVRDQWLTPEKVQQLDAWPHPGSFVREGGFAAWRVREKITVASMDRLLAEFTALRRLLQ